MTDLRVDLEKSLNLKKVTFYRGIVLEICKIALENLDLSLKNRKNNDHFGFIECAKK